MCRAIVPLVLLFAWAGSRYSHMGILHRDGGRWFVDEAIQPVTLTLTDWIGRGKSGHYVVKRLRNDSVLTPAVLKRMRAAGERHRGRDYDLYFEWSDARSYRSELRELGLSHPAVRAKMRERYGSRVPQDEPVIMPGAMFEVTRR